MSRPVTLFTGQWADLPLEEVAKKAGAWGFDGLELACWGDHFEVDKALESDKYIRSRWDILKKNNLTCFTLSTHLVGQCVADDPIDERHKNTIPARIWGDGDPEGVRQRAAEEIKNTAIAARKMGVSLVDGFTGSPIWKNFYFFPPTTQDFINRGYQSFAERWLPILDVFQKEGVKFALEIHPAEIAYDIVTAQRTLEVLKNHPAFGFNFDPSHLIHQFINPAELLHELGQHILHVHIKDTRLKLTGRSSILGSHLDFGDYRRGWDFASLGHGDVKWDPIIRGLNEIDYKGPLSIEWEDSGMDREWGAPEALKLVRSFDFPPSPLAFDAAYASIA